MKDIEKRRAKQALVQRRNKSDPFTERINFPSKVSTNGVSRSKTIPGQSLGSNYPGRNHIDHFDSLHKENGFTSSAESESEQPENVQSRKKKSRFKKATAILGHFLNRKEKKKDAKNGDHLQTPSQSRKVSETLSVDSAYRKSELDSQKNTDSPKNRKSTLFSSLRRNKKHKKEKDKKTAAITFESDIMVNVDSGDDLGIYGEIPLKQATGTGQIENKVDVSLPPPPPPSIPSSNTVGPTETRSDVSFPPIPPPHRSKSSSPPASGMGAEQLRASSSSTNYPASDQTSTTVRSSSLSNVLDDPGEDIDYMDLESPELSSQIKNNRFSNPRKMSLTKFHDSEGILNLSWLAQLEMESKLDGITVSETKAGTDTVDGASKASDIPEGAQRQISKEEIYVKIAKKLADMADQYSTLPENTASGGGAAVSLSDLEKEIIACIRSEGDRNSTVIEEKIEVIAAQTVQESYEKFKSTIQSTVSKELSWDHLAFVFYTTKAVISAVGKGSSAAVKAKEFTLDYINDTFATWIIDQGGFADDEMKTLFVELISSDDEMKTLFVELISSDDEMKTLKYFIYCDK
ncbi:hypothetical protein Btru_030876 [Bulinus truncatus]|nr:hypothetical protein Btru_030876 [Bulinus truncatus]